MILSARHLQRNLPIHLELTLALIKPDACSNPYVLQSIRQTILSNDLYIVRSRFLRLNKDDGERFYSAHRGKFFYNRLVSFMTSGPIYAHILAGTEAVERWRTLMGPTKSYKAHYEAPDSIRGRFGLTDTRNATHGSDSLSSAMNEIRFFFPNFCVEDWYKCEELYFRSRHVVFNEEAIEHRVIKDEHTVST